VLTLHLALHTLRACCTSALRSSCDLLSSLADRNLSVFNLQMTGTFLNKGSAVCRDPNGGKTALDSALKMMYNSVQDGHSNMRLKLAYTDSLYATDASKHAPLQERLQRYSTALAEQCQTKEHAELIGWQPAL
jgi:hypothetical protein